MRSRYKSDSCFFISNSCIFLFNSISSSFDARLWAYLSFKYSIVSPPLLFLFHLGLVASSFPPVFPLPFSACHLLYIFLSWLALSCLMRPASWCSAAAVSSISLISSISLSNSVFSGDIPEACSSYLIFLQYFF